MDYINKRATAEIPYVYSAMWGHLKIFYFDFILVGFPDKIVPKLFSHPLKNINSKKAVFVFRFKF